MMRYKYSTARRILSAALMADAANDGIDALSGMAALIALSLTLYNPARFPHADHYGAFVIGTHCHVHRSPRGARNRDATHGHHAGPDA